jgi:hypothetical protein
LGGIYDPDQVAERKAWVDSAMERYYAEKRAQIARKASAKQASQIAKAKADSKDKDKKKGSNEKAPDKDKQPTRITDTRDNSKNKDKKK